MRAFPVRMPSGVRYWTVIDEDLRVVPAADAYLRQVRFGRDGAESTTKTYAGAVALYLRWCAATERDWSAARTPTVRGRSRATPAAFRSTNWWCRRTTTTSLSGPARPRRERATSCS